MNQQVQADPALAQITEDSVEQMLDLAERLRQANGGTLDESAIQAVSEATGTPTEFVRLAVKLRSEKQKRSFLSQARAQFLTLEPETRRSVQSAVFASLTAFLFALEERLVLGEGNSYGIPGMLALVALTAGLYNVCLTRDAKAGAITGAIFGGLFTAIHAVFLAVLQVPARVEPFMLIPATLLGAVGGLVLHKIVNQYRGKLGLKDPVKERQELLRQLVDLQERLKSGEQSMTFMSVDMVGSTKIKEITDPLSVEFTFNEYHQFVERVTRKYGGRVHSTAGDGITCAFDHPQQAFGAARNIQTGIIELNTFRNKTGMPIQLRIGVHTGTVVTPRADDIKSLNFAHVIDVAAHLQKTAPPGGVVVSDAAAMYLPGGPSVIGSEKVSAAGVPGTVWAPRAVAPPEGGSAPPPTPGQS